MTDTATTTPTKAIPPMVQLRDQLAARMEQFKMALPAHIPAERFFRIVLTAVQINPDLLACNRQSLFNSCMRCAQDGLLPDGREAALVPFKQAVTYMPMYQGLLKKFRNSGQFKWITSGVVYEGENYEHFIDETGEHFKHVPGEHNGKIKRIYALATTKDGGSFIHVMSPDDVDKRRKFSRASREDAPWNVWPEEMMKKTAIRGLAKLLPMSSDLDDLMRKDEDLYEFDENEKAPASTEQVAKTRESGVQSMLDHFGGSEQVAGQQPTEQHHEEQQEATSENTATSDVGAMTPPIQAAFDRGKADRAKGMQKRATPVEFRTNDRTAEMNAWLNGWEAGTPPQQ